MKKFFYFLSLVIVLSANSCSVLDRITGADDNTLEGILKRYANTGCILMSYAMKDPHDKKCLERSSYITGMSPIYQQALSSTDGGYDIFGCCPIVPGYKTTCCNYGHWTLAYIRQKDECWNITAEKYNCSCCVIAERPRNILPLNDDYRLSKISLATNLEIINYLDFCAEHNIAVEIIQTSTDPKKTGFLKIWCSGRIQKTENGCWLRYDPAGDNDRCWLINKTDLVSGDWEFTIRQLAGNLIDAKKFFSIVYLTPDKVVGLRYEAADRDQPADIMDLAMAKTFFDF